MTLLQELLTLIEGEDIHHKNLNAINNVLKFDGDYELGPKTGNQCDKLAEDAHGNTLWYISLNEPAGDCEAYVVCDKKGDVSYYDHTHRTGVVDGKIVSVNVPRSWLDQLDDLVDEYKFESSTAKPEGIAAYIDLLKGIRE